MQPATDHSTWLQALDDFERWLARLSRIDRWVTLPASLLILYPLYLSGSEWFIWTLAALSLGIAIRWVYARVVRGRTKTGGPIRLHPQHKQLLEQIRHADIAMRIRCGALSGNEMIEHTPALARWLVPALRPDERVRILRRVVTGLEWYTGPPRGFSSKYWGMAAAFSGLPIINILLGASSGWGGVAVGLWCWSMFMSLTLGAYVESAQLLIAYLREAWLPGLPSGSIQETPSTPSAVSEGVPGTSSPVPPDRVLTSQVLLIVNQAEQDLEKGLIEVSVLSLLPLMVGGVALFSSGSAWPFLSFTVPLMLATNRNWWFMAGYSRWIRARLDESTVAQRLIAGEYSRASIETYVPAAFRFLLRIPSKPKGYAGELRDQYWRLACNLDWYLDSPRVLVRPYWVTTGVQLLFAASCIGLLVSDAFRVSPVLDAAGAQVINVLFSVVMIALALPGAFYCLRARIWVEELSNYLRRCAGQ